jgi:DNA-binding response OmpR family regulator
VVSRVTFKFAIKFPAEEPKRVWRYTRVDDLKWTNLIPLDNDRGTEMDERKTILVVDDMSNIRNILRFTLEKEGYRVILASNGEQALDYASVKKPPDLMILDVMMPRMDGYEVLRRLRASEGTKHIPVIFLTAKAQQQDVLKGLEAGGNDYIVKPYKFLDLQRKIEKLINQADCPRELAVIMFTDIVGFSRKMEVDEDKALNLLEDYNKATRMMLQKHRGTEVKTIGDAFLVMFRSAVDAVNCGIEMQQCFKERGRLVEEIDDFNVRIGIHLGDVVLQHGDVFGSGVNIAARVQELADPGGICVTEDLYDVAKKQMSIEVVPLENIVLKNIKESPGVLKVVF